VRLRDPLLARIVHACEELPGQELFRGPPRSPPDAKKKIITAIDAAAARLNNTRAVSRKRYVHPRIPEAWVEGELIDVFNRAEGREHLSHSEAAVLGVLADTSAAR
jgi:DNA topoisomerase IB